MAKSWTRCLRSVMRFPSCVFSSHSRSFGNGCIHRSSVSPSYRILFQITPSGFQFFYSTPALQLLNTSSCFASSITKYRSFGEISSIRSNHSLSVPTGTCQSIAAHVFYLRNSSSLRRLYSGTSNPGKLGISESKSPLMKPMKTGWSPLTRYKAVIGLQIDAFWKRNYLVLVGVSGIILCFFLWRLMFKIANTFVGFSEGMSKYGFLALSASIVTFSGAYVRSRYTINPDKVYRMAMRRLNTSASILEVMGAPLSGTEIRAYVMSGGGLTLKTFKPNLRSKRCFLIFPIHGSEKKGLVSVEVKKKKGQYDMKLLAVDVAVAVGNEQRLFVVGDEDEYRVGGGLISELRDPVVRAMEAANEFENLDTIEEEMDALKQIEAAEEKQPAKSNKL